MDGIPCLADANRQRRDVARDSAASTEGGRPRPNADVTQNRFRAKTELWRRLSADTQKRVTHVQGRAGGSKGKRAPWILHIFHKSLA